MSGRRASRAKTAGRVRRGGSDRLARCGWPARAAEALRYGWRKGRNRASGGDG
eukprot:CAMPEP_0185811222 /NCGR_PEP_ID=MMETSP1322-20130828/7685_1 /TAXON_ID=265543 /ORGANISM="Minutocellus polymorphus, Strain RCC2270" /LENGTH=52 /DNA_ID=CAMNT_0028507619 /DNA_START=424 /DNA_END=582 /DNA_ORIENTATION=-